MNELIQKCEQLARQIVEAKGQQFWAARGALNKGTPPPAPTPPSYGEGVETAAQWSPIIAGVESARRLGKEFTYEHPDTGEIKTVDFTNLGDVEMAKVMQDFQNQSASENARVLLDLYKEYGPQFVESSRDQLRQADPKGFEARETLGDKVLADMDNIPSVPDAPELESLDQDTVLQADPETLAARKDAERSLMERLQSGEFSRRAAKRAGDIAKGRQAASGNIFGGGAVLQQSIAETGAEDAASRQAVADYLGFLQSGQSAEDYTSRLAMANQQNRLTGQASRNQAAQQNYANAMNRLSGQETMNQQRMGNLQAFAFGQPLVNQLGSLGGMQQQAAPYAPTQVAGYGQSIGQQMGNVQSLNQSNYQGAMQAWQTQAQAAMQPSGFGSVLGTAFGAFAGGAGEGLGAGYAKSKWGTTV